MTRGEAPVNKVHYQGAEEDFIVFIDDIEEYNKWKTDKSVPMSNFMGSFKIFITHKQGAEGNLDGASKATLENEFNTKNDEEAIQKILEGGSLQTGRGQVRSGDRNVQNGPRGN